MPELPEVETVCRGLQSVMEGKRIARVEVRRSDLRFPLQKDFIARLEGQMVMGLGRRAKYLLTDLSSGEVLLMHLGMSGSFRVTDNASVRPKAFSSEVDASSREENATKQKDRAPFRSNRNGKGSNVFYYPRGDDRTHDHVVFHLASGVIISFNDPRRFGYMKIIPRDKLDAEPFLRGLGPEPLGNAFDAALLATACKSKKTSLKAVLLDQRVVAGLGNIYVCEALHRAHLSPKRQALMLAMHGGTPTIQAKRLVDAIHTVLKEAIAAGGSSLRDHRQTSGELGTFQHSFRVYDREGEKCPTKRCKGIVKRFIQNGRSTFWCPICQK